MGKFRLILHYCLRLLTLKVLALLSALMPHGVALINIIHARRHFLLFHLLKKFVILWVINTTLIIMECLLLESSRLLKPGLETQIGYFLTTTLLGSGGIGMHLIDFREMVFMQMALSNKSLLLQIVQLL